MDIIFEKNGIYVDIEITPDGAVKLWNCSAQPRQRIQGEKHRPIVEIQGQGYNNNLHHGSKYCFSGPGNELKYESHQLTENAFSLRLKTDEIRAQVQWDFYPGLKALRAQVTVENIGKNVFPLEYVSSFALSGLGGADDPRNTSARVGIPHNAWYGECQWAFPTLHEAGFDVVNGREGASTKRIHLSTAGNWPCVEYLPMGAYLLPDQAMVWQIEAPGSWQWEIGDVIGELYLLLSGPAWREHHFMKNLQPGESFQSVPCALAFGNDFDACIGELTDYRRLIRRPNEDNQQPAVIFNDYMNCLMGDPTTEKELPLIDEAARLGCKYYCIDAGWYDDGPWWDGVGQWLPAKQRFPGGLKIVMDYIRQKGMIPGLWLEIEVMGIKCPLKDQTPNDWFFSLGGRRITDERRWQLDFRNPAVRAHADAVLRRLIEEYGVGYIKMDYNICPGVGTDYQADSPGDGLLAHERAYMEWVDDLFRRYPQLVIENCSSGGMRMEYAHLRSHSIQSITDQTNYIKMASIACNCTSAVTPEQAAIWSYPTRDGDEEETIFNMINSILLRIHQSGHLAELSENRLALVKNAVDLHLSLVDELKFSRPFWPMGLSRFGDEWLCMGLRCGDHAYLAVWHTTENAGEWRIDLPAFQSAQCIYPPSGADAALEQAAQLIYDYLPFRKAMDEGMTETDKIPQLVILDDSSKTRDSFTGQDKIPRQANACRGILTQYWGIKPVLCV